MKPYTKFFESSWSRIIQHIQDGNSFAVISAYRSDKPLKKNKELHKQLKEEIKKLQYGYIEQKSGYSYKGTDTIIEEESFFIPEISKEDALKLCNKFSQESILFKDNTGFFLILADGTQDTEFKTDRDENTGIVTFNPEVLKTVYSKLKKGTQHQRDQKFAFQLKECIHIEEYRIPDRYESYKAIKTGILPVAKYMRIV